MAYPSNHRLPFILMFAMGIVSTTAVAAGTVTYRVTDLGVLEPAWFESSGAGGLNEAGYVVGGSTVASGDTGTHATLWIPGTGLHDLTPEGHGGAIAINDTGQVAGTRQGPTTSTAFRWSLATGIQNLPPLPGHNGSYATGIDNAGRVVGASYFHDGTSFDFRFHAIVWDATGRAQDLGPGTAEGINDLGQVVGVTGDQASAFVWTSMQGTTTFSAGSTTFASDINNLGQVTGYYAVDGPAGVVHDGFVWSAAGGLQPMHAPVNLSPAAINDAGMVVGNASGTAFLWTAEEGVRDLNMLIDPAHASESVYVEYANDINQAGQIAATGYIDGHWHGLLLTPVPEPGTAALFALGLLGLGVRARRVVPVASAA